MEADPALENTHPMVEIDDPTKNTILTPRSGIRLICQFGEKKHRKIRDPPAWKDPIRLNNRTRSGWIISGIRNSEIPIRTIRSQFFTIVDSPSGQLVPSPLARNCDVACSFGYR